VRSTDGGDSWQQIEVPSRWDINAIDFVDSAQGIAVAFLSSPFVMTTTDGGVTWRTYSMDSKYGAVACKAFGDDAYEVLGSLDGPLYFTSDAWKTVDSTNKIFDFEQELARGRRIDITGARFAGSDTVIASGVYATDSTPMCTILYRTTNRGLSWHEITDLPSTGHGLRSMTSIQCDTIVASSPSFNNLLLSTDRGITWRLDTIIMKQVFLCVVAPGLVRFADGSLLAALSMSDALFGAVRIYRRPASQSQVESYERIIYGTKIYPNPATVSVTVESNDPSHDISLEDILGREVQRQRMGADGKGSFMVSDLPRGVYQLRIHHDGKLLPVGRVVLN
jgi:hypothetical protein